ncbi:MAG: hypothetical protein EOP88_06540 [Verrucomicrobiaceae bacterium]|nr:MAG: hypothetical protein EOP88_06540 [Verrucomicrobiaceae bacterium]
MTNDPLISMALLGTARLAVLPPAPDPMLEKTWSAIASEDPADAVLQALALTRAMYRAGAGTQADRRPVAACAVDSDGIFSAAAVDTLSRMLRGEFRELLPEWMRLAAESGRVVPGRVLPELLAEASKDHSLRGQARQIAGGRGRWIAARHERFAWLLEDRVIQDGSWEDGTPGERIAWLREARGADAAVAMAAVASTWSGEDVAMREAVVRLVAGNPLESDEQWLEKEAMKDRRQEVRELAAAALAGLGDSAFRKRAAERIMRHVKLQRKLLRRVITVEPPQVFDPAWTADGLKEKPPQGTGEKAWWLRQIAGMLPLDAWADLLGCGPADLFGLAVDGDWQDPLLSGWLDAARRFPHRALAEQTVPFLATLQAWPATAPHRVTVISSILEPLPVARRYELLDGIAGRIPTEMTLALLERFQDAPPPGTGKRALAVIDVALAATPPVIHRQQARALALCIPQDAIQTRLELLAKLPEISPAAEEFATALEFRRTFPTHFKKS